MEMTNQKVRANGECEIKVNLRGIIMEKEIDLRPLINLNYARNRLSWELYKERI